MALTNKQITLKILTYYKSITLTTTLLLAVITFLVYLPALQNDFVNWDDQLYVYENLNIQSIDSGFFRWLLTAQVSSHWHPLTILSLALDNAVWGFNPSGYHLTNIILHSINTSLVFILVYRLIQCGLIQNSKFKIQNFSYITGIVTALLFGIHPLHVESVAWISERKDVLYAFFFLFSLLFYTRYLTSKGSSVSIYYALCLFSFILSLISKPMAVTLPVVLLILDHYPFKRLTGNWGIRDLKWLFIEKFPFIILVFLSSLATIWVQTAGGALKSVEAFPPAERAVLAVRGYVFYLAKMLLPLDLAPFYPYPAKIDLFALEYTGSLLLFSAITLYVIRSSKKTPLFLSAWLYYIFTFIPVIGIIKVGDQAAADRYTYLPSLAPFFLAGLCAASLFERSSKKQYRLSIITVSITLTAMLAGMTIKQIGIWKDSITLWSHEISVFPENDAGYNSRGLAYNSIGDFRDAIKDYDKAIELSPEYIDAYNNRGTAYSALGNYLEAVSDYSRAIELYPFPQGYYNRGIAYYNSGNFKEALRDYDRAIERQPDYAEAYNNRGTVHYMSGNYQQALKDFETAIKLNPHDSGAYRNREEALKRLRTGY